MPGSHQVRNAERLRDANAVEVVMDSDMTEKPAELLESIRHLVKSPRLRADMADNLAKEARSNAAHHLAEIILEEA